MDERKVVIKGKEIKYGIKKSRRARRARLTIYPPTKIYFYKTGSNNVALEHRQDDFGGGINCDVQIVATIPDNFSENILEKFISQKIDWILRKTEYFRLRNEKNKGRVPLKSSQRDYKKYKEKALALAKNRLQLYNQFYGFKYKKISIRNQKTRWGSCSRNGHLSFNYKIALISRNLSNYIIVHELCHLGEFNHSPRFWNLVEKTIPDCRKLRKEVRMI